MLRPRLIPCLLVSNGRLIKTRDYQEYRYLGDPINATKIFSELECDEILVLDIQATESKRRPDFQLVKNISASCRMPLTYGGGIKTLDDAERLIQLGVEKVSVCSEFFGNPKLIGDIANRIGSQSTVGVVELDKVVVEGKALYSVIGRRNKLKTDLDALEWIKKLADMGAGEILLNFVNSDGMRCGYDSDYIAMVKETIDIPLTVMGGSKSLSDLANLIARVGTIGVAIGSLFLLEGLHDAPLINYPDKEIRNRYAI
jgi:cyclase